MPPFGFHGAPPPFFLNSKDAAGRRRIWLVSPNLAPMSSRVTQVGHLAAGGVE